MKHNKKGANLVGKQEKTKSGFQKLQKEEADKKNICCEYFFTFHFSLLYLTV